jgi:hypothetical protein
VRRYVQVSSRPHGMSNHGGEAPVPLQNTPTPARSSHITTSTSRDMETISEMGHMITVGLRMLRVRRQNPPDGSEHPRMIRARDEVTQGR